MARDLGAARIAEDARALAERLREGRFYVVCVGQFKRGKSTLLNALVGSEILPTGVVPVTAVVTIARYGEQLTARVRRGEEDWTSCEAADLPDYVTEERNPANRKDVKSVEVFVPSRLLEGGMSLVDTPGLGSVLEAGAIATEAFVPHIDAAIVVLGTDPPISGDELALVERIAHVTSRLVFVLNKADRVSDADRLQAIVFTEHVLRERLGRAIDPILTVSATEALEDGPSRYDWNRLVAVLDTLARTSGADMLREAEARGAKALTTALLEEIDGQRDALLRPLEESEARIEPAAERSTPSGGVSPGPRASTRGVQERLLSRFTVERDGFFERAVWEAVGELQAAVHGVSETGSALRRRALDLTAQVATRTAHGSRTTSASASSRAGVCSRVTSERGWATSSHLPNAR